MKKKVTIIDYGMGNIESLKNAISKVGYNPLFYSNEKKILSNIVVIPGVGAFSHAMKLINQKKIYNDILQFSQIKNNLIFGICLGMQILFDEGKENGETKGLGLIEGSVDLIRCKKSEKLPLVGWYNSKINVHENFKFLSKFNNEKFYHIHSYVASPIHPNNILGKSSYKGNTFCSITTNGSNILGTQFHPEKSSNIGLEFIQTLFKQID